MLYCAVCKVREIKRAGRWAREKEKRAKAQPAITLQAVFCGWGVGKASGSLERESGGRRASGEGGGRGNGEGWWGAYAF